MSSGKQFQYFTKLFTPQKQYANLTSMNNSTRSFRQSSNYHRPIFTDTSFRSTGKKNSKVNEVSFKQPLQHYEIKQIITDDFCGCQTTLSTCERIGKNYFSSISLGQLKSCYQNEPKPQHAISKSSKTVFLSQLPPEYPQIYHSHLSNLLDHFDSLKMTTPSFLFIAWVHFHCKLQYVTYFFETDLKNALKSSSKFRYDLQLELIKQNINLNESVRQYRNLNLSIESFMEDYFQSAGAILIPVTQYAKFLQIVKRKGERAFVQLMALFLVNKQKEFYQILKYWTHSQISNLRNYSRFLNWDLFFKQVQEIK